MTREPFIAHSELTNEIYIVVGKEKYRVTEQAIKAVMAIKALEQEPCEDAISRKALFDMCKKEIDHISKNWQNYHSPSEAKSGFAYIATNIYDLPSVTPQSKTGHWYKANSYDMSVAVM